MSEWADYTIEQLASPIPCAVVDGPFGSNLKTSDYVEDGIPVLQGNNITNDKFNFSGIRYITEKKAYELIRSAAKEGDLLVVKIGSVGYSALIDNLHGFDFAIIPANLMKATLNKDIVVAKYVYYVLTSEVGKKRLIDLATNTAQPALSLRTFKNLSFKYPKIKEQKKIVEILTAVDNFIEKTEALIEKYQAIKQGMMHDLLTRGIDSNGQLRPSHHDAPHLYKQTELGLIPKEWGVTAIGGASKFVTSGSRGWAQYYSNEGSIFVRITNLTREHINFRWDDMQHVAPPTGGEGSRTALEEGDVLISITADLGIIAVVPSGLQEAYINQHIALVRPKQHIVNQRFLGMFLASDEGQEQFKKYDDPGAKSGLNLPTIRGIKFPLPMLNEQVLIASRIDVVDGVIDREKKNLDKNRKIKKGLMQDLLTGKVRVK